MKAKILDTREIALDVLDIGTSQVRTHNVRKGIEDLALSIDRLGLLEPIVVKPTEGDRFEILTGQRRFLAHQHLELPTIRAQIVEGEVDSEMATAISLTENMVRADISTKEYIDACTELFRKYGSIKAVSEGLGLPRYKVSQYVKFDQLTDELKQKVSGGEVTMDLAIRAVRAATDSEGVVDSESATVFADEMSGLSDLQRKNLENAAKANPGAPVELILEEGRKQPKQKRLTIVISSEMDLALDKFANDEGSEKNDAAASLLDSSLTDKGYL